MMNSGFTQQMRQRILASPDGSVFTASDFADIADTAAVRQGLTRLTQDELLRRVFRGVYEKPKYSKLLDEFVATSPDAVANALARSYHWTISPSGNTALNLLGLSEQVTATWDYISDGPYKTYEWDKNKIEFRHRTNREITGLSYTSSLVVQALKSLGKDRVTLETIHYLSGKLNPAEKEALLRESQQCSDWVVDAVRKICIGGAA